jgi:hypothetical protein
VLYPRTASLSDRVGAAMSSVVAPFLADAAEEGKNIVLSMLVVGLVILAVIGLGELNTWLAHRRSRARH